MERLWIIIKMSYKIIGKYIKELKFNIPSPKTFFLLSKDITNYKINIDIKSSQAKQNIIEVLTSLSLTPTKDGFETINTKIIFSTIIELENNQLSKNDMEKIILIEVPTKIYPELRKIFVFLFENSGFKDVKISESVDFDNLYKMRKVQ
jgi:preprotein translocase subunit SecB